MRLLKLRLRGIVLRLAGAYRPEKHYMRGPKAGA